MNRSHTLEAKKQSLTSFAPIGSVCTIFAEGLKVNASQELTTSVGKCINILRAPKSHEWKFQLVHNCRPSSPDPMAALTCAVPS
jgi:hypothetical protein